MIDRFWDVAAEDVALIDRRLLTVSVTPGEGETSLVHTFFRAACVEKYSMNFVVRENGVGLGVVQPGIHVKFSLISD